MKRKIKEAQVIEPYKNKNIEDIPGEIWKDIPGIEGYGMISSYGRVKRLAFEFLDVTGRKIVLEERIQAIRLQKNFNQFKQDFKVHLQSRLQIESVCHSISIGRVMYYCFVEKFDLNDRSLSVTYKDGNGLNLHPDNLLLTDLSGLQQRIMAADRKDLHFGHSEENQRLFTQMGRAVKIKKVHQYDMEGNYVATFESLSEAAASVGITISSVSSSAYQRTTLTAGGFIWRMGKRRPRIAVATILKRIRATRGAPVTQYDLDGEKIKTYYNVAQAAKAIGVERRSLSSAVNGDILVFASSVWRKGEADRIDTTKEKKSLSLRQGYTISQYDLQGKKIKTFTKSREASAYANAPNEQINAMAIRDDILLKGYIWRYGDADHLDEAEIEQIRQNISKPKCRDITQYTLKGVKIGYFTSIVDAAQQTGVPPGGINSCVDGRKATAGGYIWRRGNGKAILHIPETPRPLGNKLTHKIDQFDLDGKKIATYASISEAARTTEVHKTTIAAAVRGSIKTAGGFVWKRNK